MRWRWIRARILEGCCRLFSSPTSRFRCLVFIDLLGMRLTTPESTSYSMSGIQRGIHSFHAWAGALAGSGIWDEFGRRWDLAFVTSIMRTIWGGALKEGGGRGLWVCMCVHVVACIEVRNRYPWHLLAVALAVYRQLLLLTTYWKLTGCALLVIVPSDEERCVGLLPVALK